MTQTTQVCIIDDDDVSLMLGKQILARAGYQVHTFASVARIDWKTVAGCQFILLDLLMEGEDGLDVIEQLEQIDFKGAVHIVTGLEIQGADALVGRLLGSKLLISGIIQKPFFSDTLLAALDEALDATRVLPFSEESLRLLELAMGSRQFQVRRDPVLHAAGGRVHSYVLNIEVILGWQGFHYRRLDALIQHGGLQDLWLDRLFRLVGGDALRPDARLEQPQTLSLPARLLLDAEILTRIAGEPDLLSARGLTLRPMVAEQEYLLYGPRLQEPLAILRELGYSLVLDSAWNMCDVNFLPVLKLFDEVRLQPANPRHPARHDNPDQSKMVELLHQNGIALTWRTPYAWLTQRPEADFRPELCTSNSALHNANRLRGTA